MTAEPDTAAGAKRGLLRDARRIVLVMTGLFVALLLLLRLPLVASGTFVDPAGEPVHDVMVSSRMDTLRFGPRWRSRGLVGERFIRACMTCGSVHLNFSKEGFLSETLDIYADHEPHGTPVVRERSWLFGMVKRVEVTLEPLANPVALTALRAELDIRQNRLPIVMPLVAGIDPGPQNTVESRMAAVGTSSPGFFALGVDRDPQGLIVTAKQRHPNWRTPGSGAPEFDFASNLVLTFHGAESGGILFDVPDNLPRLFPSQQVLRRMREAPEDGYATTVALPLDATHDNNAWYFWFRNADTYGKGELQLPSVARDRKRLTATVRIWLNETPGGRDLRAEHYR